MKKIFTIGLLAASAVTAAFAQDGVVKDFNPEISEFYYQMGYDTSTGESVPEVRIVVRFDEDVWWRAGYSKQCYLLDADNLVYGEWTPDFFGLASDYTQLSFGVRGLSPYVDADYTLVIPEDLLGNTTWNTNGYETGRSNPELRYEFNMWELAGRPREDKTVYDFEPVAGMHSVEEVRLSSGQRALELQLPLDFPEPVAIYKKVLDKCNASDPEGNRIEDKNLRFFVAEDNPNRVIVGLRGIDMDKSVDYTISIWSGSFGTLEWESEDYYEGRSNSPLEYVVNPATTAVKTVIVEDSADAPVYNLFGVKMNGRDLDKGVYIRNGEKFVVK